MLFIKKIIYVLILGLISMLFFLFSRKLNYDYNLHINSRSL